MLKRLIDILGAGFALLILSPILLITTLMVWSQMGLPVLFRQTRPGLHGKPFQMIKFRTMRNASDSKGKLLPDSERITRIGRFLRSTSLDELPELWNVLKGDMSLVGPRPLLMEYLEYYTEEEMLRHSVRPGVTGLAQVSGRNASTWDDRLSYDVQYVRTHSLKMDLRIIAKTIRQVIKQEGVVVVPSTAYRKLSEERSKQ